MPYNPTTHTIERNATTGKWEVGLGDIRAALHSGWKWINNLVTSPRVNRWAKYKPVEGVDDSLSYDIHIGTNYRGAETTGSSVASSQVYSCGMSLVPSMTLDAAIARAPQKSDWQYTRRPKSAVTEPYHAKRAGDFRGYCHTAQCWMQSVVCDDGSDVYAGEGAVDFTVSVTETTSDKELRATDMIIGGNALSTWNKGLLFVEDMSKRDGPTTPSTPLKFVTSEQTISDADSALLNSSSAIGGSRTYKVYGAYVKVATGTSGARLVSSYTNGIVPMAMNPVEVKIRPAAGIMTCQYLTLTREGLLTYHIIIGNHRNDTMVFHKTTALQSNVPQYWQKIRTYASQSAADADTDGEGSGYLAQEDTTGSLEISKLRYVSGSAGVVVSGNDYTIPAGGSITFEFTDHDVQHLMTDISTARIVKSFSRMRYQASDLSWKTSNLFTQDGAVTPELN